MQVIHLKSGVAIEVQDAAVGCGGEGAVHRVVQNKSLAVKLFDDGVIGERRKRIEHFVANPIISSETDCSFATPLALVLNPQTREVVGYVLPFFDGAIDLEEFFAWAQSIDFGFRVRVAKNLTNALIDLHDSGILQRDHTNDMVMQNGSIGKVDLDSFHVGSTHIAGTGKDATLPSEILRLDVDQWENTPCSSEQDAWSHAVVVWKLLRGHHPFDVHYVGSDKCPSLRERILQGWFPYGSNADPDYEVPDGAEPLQTMEPGLRQYFRTMFVDGHSNPSKRPTLHALLDVLESLDSVTDVTLLDSTWQAITGVNVTAAPTKCAASPATRRKAVSLSVSACVVPLIAFIFWPASVPLKEEAAASTEVELYRPRPQVRADIPMSTPKPRQKPVVRPRQSNEVTPKPPAKQQAEYAMKRRVDSANTWGSLGSIKQSHDGEAPEIFDYLDKR